MSSVARTDRELLRLRGADRRRTCSRPCPKSIYGARVIAPGGSMCPLRSLIRLFACLALISPGVVLAADEQSSTAPLELVVLGSGGPGATGRASSCYLVLIDGTPRILVDAGPGAFARLGEAKLSLEKTDIVLLTHLHIDHSAELPGLFKARAVASSEPIIFNVWGPEGSRGSRRAAYFPSTSRFLHLLFGPVGAFAYLSDFAAPITIRAHDISTQTQSRPKPQVIYTGRRFRHFGDRRTPWRCAGGNLPYSLCR